MAQPPTLDGLHGEHTHQDRYQRKEKGNRSVRLEQRAWRTCGVVPELRKNHARYDGYQGELAYPAVQCRPQGGCQPCYPQENHERQHETRVVADEREPPGDPQPEDQRDGQDQRAANRTEPGLPGRNRGRTIGIAEQAATDGGKHDDQDDGHQQQPEVRAKRSIRPEVIGSA